MRTQREVERGAQPARCRLRIGSETKVSLTTEGVAILELDGVRSVGLDAHGALQIDFDPRAMPVADLVQMLEYAGLIAEGVPWSVHPRASAGGL